MKDINFFLPYIDKKRLKFNNKFFLGMIFTVFFLSILGYGVFNHFKIKKLSENSNKLQEIAENPKTLEKVKVISREEEDLNKFKTELESIKDLKSSVDEKDFIDSVYINSIVSKKPKDLFFTSININTGNISITGASNNRLSVAELGQGLKDIENFKDIFISSVTREETVYNFDLEIDLIGEAEDGIIEEEIEESEEAQE